MVNRKAKVVKLTDEQKSLVESNLDMLDPITSYMLIRYKAPPSEREDALQDAAVGLIQAAQRFDSSRNDNFSGYASVRMFGSVLDGLRDRVFRRTASRGRGACEVPLNVRVLRARDSSDLIEARLTAASILNRLPGDLQWFVRRRFFEDASHAEISEELGVGKSRVSQLEKRYLEILARRLS